DKMPERDPDDFRYTDLVGYLVVDEQEGELGEITAVQEFPQQFLATVDFDGQELLFPLSEDLILGIDEEEQVIEVELPEGLIDLYRELQNENKFHFYNSFNFHIFPHLLYEMKIIDHIKNANGKTLFSFELLPPAKGQGIQSIFSTMDELMEFNPPFIDVTYHREDRSEEHT